MIVEIFSLCDAATEQHGRLNLLGTFDTIWADQAPITYPQCAVAIRMRFSKIEEGEHALKLSVVNADGKPLVNAFETKLNIQFHKTDRTTLTANLILNLHGLKIETHGEYAIDLAINGRQEASLPFFVSARPAQNPHE
ncbi:MAG: hypothetical protein ISR96_13345 [Nitrospira sp.]|nr:hypothetical protein [bacterium]MBL7050493.1 hypothetical protein [Nitrospira sp.]